MTNTNTMQDTIRPFALGSNVVVEIINGTIRQLHAETLELIKEIKVSALTEQQIAAIEKSRQACVAAMIDQGFLPSGSKNCK